MVSRRFDLDERAAAFARLSEECHSHLLRYVNCCRRGRLRLPGYQDEELLQHSYVPLSRRQKTFRGVTAEAFCEWAKPIIHETLKSVAQRRRKARDAMHHAVLFSDLDGLRVEDVPGDNLPLEEAHRQSDRRDAFDAVLSRLPAIGRKVIKLHHLQSMPVETVAARLRRSRSRTYKILTSSLADMHGYLSSHPRYRSRFLET